MKILIIASVLVLSLFVGVIVGYASGNVNLTPGHIQVESCSKTATIPIINWTAKGSMQIVDLHQTGDCRLRGTWNSTIPGYYCTGIGTLGGQDWVPDECITVSKHKVSENKSKFRNVFRYRYP